MDESAHPNKHAPETPTPDVAQLLRLIELQTAAQRERRAPRQKALQGAPFRYGSLVLIIIFALGSVGLMEWFVSQLPKPVRQSPGTPPPFSVLREPGGSGGSAGGKPGAKTGSEN